MFIIAKPDSLPAVMLVHTYPLTSFKVLFSHSLLSSVIEQQRLNLVMNLLYSILTVFILYFYNFLTLAVLV